MRLTVKTSIAVSLLTMLMVVFAAPAMSAPTDDTSIFMKAALEGAGLLYDPEILQEATPLPAPQQPAVPAGPSTVVDEWTDYGECIDGTRTVTHWSKHSDGSIASSLSFEPCALICVDGVDGFGNLCGFCYDPVLTSPADLDDMWDKYCPVDDPPLKDNPPDNTPPEDPPATEQPPADDGTPVEKNGAEVHKAKLPNTGSMKLVLAGLAMLAVAAASIMRMVTVYSRS